MFTYTFFKKFYKRLQYITKMKRKIVKHGNSTLTVSLPSKWAKNNSLKQGDEIDVIENGKELILNSKKEAGLGYIEIM